ncbi:hypothetical protein RI129_010712 [Pyrocoelia pectoralis]|uniref:Uncharacterized protein n=1 Tax=Pyrocoelia pectoralis TaxID=417401 RepID=A0AAN7V7G3_9COLE
MSLYERMVSIEKRLERTVNQQEEIVQQFPRYSEFLPKILESSDALRTELEAFRTCCKRLILIEDERNCLVEQVYSVPVPERMNYNALLVALYEKTRLEEEVGEIKKEQKRLILLLNTMRKTVARIDQPYFPKLARLKEVNGLLAAKVSELQQDAQCMEILENKMEVVIDDYQEYREKSTKQLNELHAKLGAVLEENERLTQTVKQYQSFNEELNSLRASMAESKSIRNERDYFKAQVEDLKSIRNTYSQIIEEPFVALRDQEMIVKNQERHIVQLQKKNAMYKIENANLKMRLEESYSQIKKLKGATKSPNEVNNPFVLVCMHAFRYVQTEILVLQAIF